MISLSSSSSVYENTSFSHNSLTEPSQNVSTTTTASNLSGLKGNSLDFFSGIRSFGGSPEDTFLISTIPMTNQEVSNYLPDQAGTNVTLILSPKGVEMVGASFIQEADPQNNISAIRIKGLYINTPEASAEITSGINRKGDKVTHSTKGGDSFSFKFDEPLDKKCVITSIQLNKDNTIATVAFKDADGINRVETATLVPAKS